LTNTITYLLPRRRFCLSDVSALDARTVHVAHAMERRCGRTV